jgi:hypothetical protein
LIQFVVSVTASHGIHLSDLIGSVIAFAGAWFVWNRR